MRAVRSLVAVLALAVALPLAPASAATAPAEAAGPLVAAHAGAHAHAPESSLIAYRNADRIGADLVEVDVQLTTDDRLVLAHDPIGNYTDPSCTGNAHDQRFDVLRACDYAYWYAPAQFATRANLRLRHPLRGTGVVIPALEEVLAEATARPDGAGLLLEIKHTPGQNVNDPDGTEVAARTVDAVVAAGLVERTIVQSFSQVVIDEVKRRAPELRTAVLAPSAAQALAGALAGGHDLAAPSVTAPDFGEDFVVAAHRAGIGVMPFTLDQVADLREALRIGVDGIITNHPACVLDLLGRPRADSVVAPELAARGVEHQPACYGSGSQPLNHPSAFGAVHRVGGADRFATAAALAHDAYPEGAQRVLLARGDVSADALAASPLAGDAPLLLTMPDRLNPATAAALERLGAGAVVLLGGPHAVGPEVEAALRGRGLDVTRVAGANRFATAAAIARAHGAAGELRLEAESVTTAVLASGAVAADALAAGPLAAAAGRPVLLTGPDRLAPEAAEALANPARGVRRVLVAGGGVAVGEAVLDEVRALGLDVRRVAGPDRTATAVAVAELTAEALGWDVIRADLAAASAVPDALAAVAHAAHDRVPLLFTVGADELGPAATAFLTAHCGELAEVVLVGGPEAVQPAVGVSASGAAICRVPSALDLAAPDPPFAEGPARLAIRLTDQLGDPSPDVDLVVEVARRQDGIVVPVERRTVRVGPDGTATVDVADPGGDGARVTVCRPRQPEDPCATRDPDTDPGRGPVRQAYQGPPVPVAVVELV